VGREKKREKEKSEWTSKTLAGGRGVKNLKYDQTGKRKKGTYTLSSTPLSRRRGRKSCVHIVRTDSSIICPAIKVCSIRRKRKKK